MLAVVMGGGPSGRALSGAIRERGWDVRLLSRRTGVDVLHDDFGAAIEGARVVVEATGRFTTSRRRATAFFTTSTAAVGGAAARAGARHVLLSIVGCTRADVQGYGYFAGKAEQERVAKETGADLTLVRSTQWHEFAEQTVDRLRVGPLALVPGMTIAPVALGAVAQVVADVVVGERPGPLVELSGPEVRTLWSMTSALPRTGSVHVPLRMPGDLGRAFRGGSLLPAAGSEVVGPTFDAWLRERQG